jgi:nucleoside-diphosphate-sugar epimerase
MLVHLTWVRTLAEAIAAACEDAAPPPHRELNVADAAPVSVTDLAALAAAAAGVEPRIEVVEEERYRAAEAAARREGASQHAWFPFRSTPDFALAVDRLAAELGVVPASTAVGTQALFDDYAAGRYSAGPADFLLDDLLAGERAETVASVH